MYAEAHTDRNGTDRSIVIVALAAGIIAAGHVGKLPPALPSLRADLGIDIVTAGWLVSLFSITGMLGGIFLGAVADRINHRRFATGGLALMAVSGLCGSVSVTAPQLIVSRIFEGIGFLAVVVAAPAMIALATGGRGRRAALGFWAAYMPAGITLMLVMAPPILEAAGWRALWIVLAVIAALGAAAMWGMAGRAGERSPIEPMRESIWKNIRLGASQAGPWLVGACFALYAAQFFAVITWMPTFMVEQRQLTMLTAGTLTAAVVVGNGASSLVAGVLLHRGVAPWLMMAVCGGVIAVAAAGAFSAWMPDVLRYGFSMLLCGTGGVIAAVVFALAPAMARSPSQLGIVNGILVQASNVAQFVGPYALAAIAAMFGRWEAALWPMLAANVLLILLSLRVRRYENALESTFRSN